MRWNPEISKKLDQTDFGIVCLTPDNLDEPWIHFEAGALAKKMDTARVCPWLLGLKATDITGPLQSFQAKRADSKEETREVVREINNTSCEHSLTSERLDRAFDNNWDRLTAKLKVIAESTQTADEPSRKPLDMLEEVLEVVRDQSKVLIRIQGQLINIDRESLNYSRTDKGKSELSELLVKRARSEPVEKLLNKKFLSKNTNYETFEELTNDFEIFAGTQIVTQDDLVLIEEWSESIKSRTNFPDGIAMLRAAIAEWVQDYLEEPK